MRAWRRTRVLVFLTMLASLLAPASAQADPTQPYVTITNLVDGSFIAAQQEIDVTASFNPMGTDRPAEITLLMSTMNGVQASDPIACPDPGNATCSVSFVWDTSTTAPNRVYSLTAAVATVLSSFVESPTVTVAVGDPPASVGDLLPYPIPAFLALPGSLISATATIWTRTAGGSASLQLIADGAAASPPVACPTLMAGRNVCKVKLEWGAAATTGQHSLVARLVSGGVTADSATRTVTVQTPSAKLDAPASGSIVSGIVPITLSGTLSGLGETASSLSLLVDGRDYASIPCSDPHATMCTGSILWYTTFLGGTHTLRTMFGTSAGAVMGPPVTLTVHTDSVVSISAPTTKQGLQATVTGHVTSPYNTVLAGADVALTIRPANGAPRVVHEVSDSRGIFTVSLRASSNTAFSATVAATATYSASVSVGELYVVADPQCRAPHAARRGTPVTVTCTINGLPAGALLQLQVSAHHRWHNRIAVRSTGARTTLHLRWDVARTLWLRVAVPKTKSLTKAYSKTFSVRVH